MVHRSYSLTNRSSRRRRITVYLQREGSEDRSSQVKSIENQVVTGSVCIPTEASATVSDKEEGACEQDSQATSLAPPTVEVDLQPMASTSMSALARLLHNKLSQPDSVTWVFAGDANYCTIHDSLQAFPRLFEDYARKHLGRESDIFVNATYPGARLEHVRKRVELRFRQLKPSVVVLHCGFAECLSGVEKCSEFEQAMISLIEEVHEAGAIPIVCTPPHSDVESNSPEEIDRLIFLEAIRGSAIEHNALLVDFWNDWERKPSEVLSFFWDRSRKRPTMKGLKRMEQHLLNELHLSPSKSVPKSQKQTTSPQPELVRPN